MNNVPVGKPSYFCIRNNGKMKKITALFTASLALFAAGCDKGESPLAPDTDATTGVSIPSDGSDENGNGTAGDGKTLIPFRHARRQRCGQLQDYAAAILSGGQVSGEPGYQRGLGLGFRI